MKNNRILVLALLGISILSSQLSALSAQSTAFTYQGRLNDRGAAANGTYDFRFTIYDRATGGTSPIEPAMADRVAVSNGLFTVELDFGALGSTPRWLEIEVQSRAGAGGGYLILSPRQSLTATPRAHYALEAGDVLNPVPDALIPPTVARLGGSNVFTGQVSFVAPPRWEGPPFTVNTAAQVPNLNADYLDGLDSSAFWKVIGNAGTSTDFHFLGTTDNQPLELRVNNQRALRLEPNTNGAPNVVAGSPQNHVAPGVIGATIGGGGGNGFFSDSYTNRVLGIFGTVMGGANNTASGSFSMVGGANSTASGHSSVAVGGFAFAEGQNSFALGSCTASGPYARALGTSCEASGESAMALGNNSRALHRGSFVWADSQNPSFSSTANNQFSIRAQGGVRLNTDTSLFFGTGAKLWPDHGGAIELGNSIQNGATPYIDFHYGGGADQDFNVRLINDADGRLTCTGNLGFGAQTRQMLNLWGTFYGIGIQSATMYFRTDSSSPSGGFAWYKGGAHANGQNDAGGGTTLMRLDGSGNLNILGTFGNLSDRNAKENFRPVDAQAVLEKVASLALSEWSYRTDTEHTRHLGPMAQDFRAAFGFGADDKHITTVDADGVALAAIQGLNQKFEERTRSLEMELKRRDVENVELKQRLLQLEQIIYSTKTTK